MVYDTCEYKTSYRDRNGDNEIDADKDSVGFPFLWSVESYNAFITFCLIRYIDS